MCYVLSYRAPTYIRTETLTAALTAETGIHLSQVRNSSTGPWRYFQTLRGLLMTRIRSHPDLYILGFRGHELYWPVRLLTLGRPLVLDALMSPSESLQFEPKHGPIQRRLGWFVRWVEGAILRDAELVLTDTNAHADLLSERFRIEPAQVIPVPVGAVDRLHLPRPDDGEFRVLFYGAVAPLHGLDTMVEALTLANNRSISARIIGASSERVARLTPGAGPDMPRIHCDTWVDFDVIAEQEMQRADLCLGGPFGTSPQAGRVITGKTHQALACGRAVVVANTAAHRDAGFVHGHNCFMVEPGDPVALAAVLNQAAGDRELLNRVAAGGRALHEQAFSVDSLVDALAPILRHAS